MLQVALCALYAHLAGKLLMNPYSRKGDDHLRLLWQAILLVMVMSGYIYKKTQVTLDSLMDLVQTVLLIGMVICLVLYVLA